MPSIIRILSVSAAAFAVVKAQGVVLSAQGTAGSPASLGLSVLPDQSDANIINSQEITDNVVNECGRTLLSGNIDIGTETETQLSNNTVTSVTKGSVVQMQIAQGNADGAGPYTCDMDQTGNSLGTGQTNLTTKETDGGNGVINLAITMPADMACVGASTGNVCTVRCRNTAAAGPYGGCIAVQQTDVTAKENTPENIGTAQTAAGISAQVAQNKLDIEAEELANANAGPSVPEQGVAAVNALLSIDSTASATVAVSVSATSVAAAATKAAKGSAKGGAAAAKAAGAAAKAGANAATAKGAAKGAANAGAGANAATAKGAATAAKKNQRRRVFVS